MGPLIIGKPPYSHVERTVASAVSAAGVPVRDRGRKAPPFPKDWILLLFRVVLLCFVLLCGDVFRCVLCCCGWILCLVLQRRVVCLSFCAGWSLSVCCSVVCCVSHCFVLLCLVVRCVVLFCCELLVCLV